MDRFKKIVPIIMEYFEKYISENEIMDEFQKQMAIDEMKVAAFELEDEKYFGDIPDRLKKYAPEIEKITNETILRLYHRPAIANEHYFHKVFPLYLYIYCLKNVVSNELIKEIEEIIHKFITDYPHLVMAIDMLTDQVYNAPSLVVLGKEAADNMHNLLNPIKITRLDGKLKLYHGTSIEAYQKIIEEGHIVATDYTEIREEAESPLGKEYTQKYCDLQTGYCFFANDLSYGKKYLLVHAGYSEVKEQTDPKHKFNIREEFFMNKVISSEPMTVVFGHTTTNNIRAIKEHTLKYPYTIWYDEEFKDKIGIDCGACYPSGQLACLCLDTMEEFYVKNNLDTIVPLSYINSKIAGYRKMVDDVNTQYAPDIEHEISIFK